MMHLVLKGYILPAAIVICVEALMGLPSMIQQEFKLDPFQTGILFCSAEERRIESKGFCGKEMDFFFYTSA